MEQYHQMTLEDLANQELAQAAPGRTAYIDEYGNFGFDFSKEGTSKYYILCAVVIENKDLDEVHSAVLKAKEGNGFRDSEMKSSQVGNNYKRRGHILSELLPINFQVILLVADKQKFTLDSPLTEYKPTFIKYLHKRLHYLLYHSYPKLKIIEDEIGSSEFQSSFREYVANNRPEMNLFNEYDFDYVNSQDALLVQLADMIGGSIGHTLTHDDAPDYISMLKGKILATEHFPNDIGPFWGEMRLEDCKFDSRIYSLAVKCATDFVNNNEHEETDEIRAQVGFLRHLLFQVQNVNPLHYITSYQLLNVIQQYTTRRVTKDFLYRRVIAPLRDKGVIIASCPQGYKIPVSAEDIVTYLNQSHMIISPMLHRMEICRELIRQATSNDLDILDNHAFTKYKKYFD